MLLLKAQKMDNSLSFKAQCDLAPSSCQSYNCSIIITIMDVGLWNGSDQ